MAGKHPPVSGTSTLNSPSVAAGSPEGFDDVIDAEYETLAPRPMRSYAPAAHCTPGTIPKSICLLRDHGQGPGRYIRRPSVFWIAGILIVAAAFWTSGGHAIVGQMKPNEEQPSLLRLENIRSRLEHLDGRQLLIVDGKAINMGARTQVLPDLSIEILGGNGRTVHYFLGTRGQRLARGERFSFSSRLAAPKDGVESISVTFKE